MARHPQLERLIDLGLPRLVTEHDPGPPPSDDAVLAIHHDAVPATELAPLLRRGDKSGFVVVDLTDLAEFRPVAGLAIPDAPLYWLKGVDRGDDLQNWSPEEVLPELEQRGRSPMTVHEGISWLLQQPEVLEPSACFMTIGSRKPKGDPARGTFDSRTPAIWISGGTGRDGRESRGAPKVGWCWWRNRHTWLGFGSLTARV